MTVRVHPNMSGGRVSDTTFRRAFEGTVRAFVTRWTSHDACDFVYDIIKVTESREPHLTRIDHVFRENLTVDHDRGLYRYRVNGKSLAVTWTGTRGAIVSSPGTVLLLLYRAVYC